MEANDIWNSVGADIASLHLVFKGELFYAGNSNKILKNDCYYI